MVFLALMLLIFVAFAMMFMNMYSLKMVTHSYRMTFDRLMILICAQEEFGTFRQSVLAMFQLMNGDLDVDALVTQRPITGAVLYVIYLLLTVFLGECSLL